MDGAPPSYLPNNPSFLQDPWKSPQSFSPISNTAFDEAAEDKSCGEPQDFDCPRSPGVDLNINSFSFSPVDMEPLTSLFSFSTCSSPYKEYSGKDYKSHDTNDVYVSMKHALVHNNGSPVNGSAPSQTFAGQLSPLGAMSHNIYNQGLNRNISLEPNICSTVSPGHPLSSQSVPVSSSVTCNGYPQIQVSGSGSVGGGSGVFYTGDFTAAPASVQSHGAVFPAAMSVNLSMNMTMGVPSFGEHFVGTATSSVPTNHVQWTASHVPSSHYSSNGTPMVSSYGQPVQVQYNPSSPTHPTQGASGTYTFTAEFRPADSMSLPSVEREFSNCSSGLKTMSGSFYPCKHPSVTVESSQTNGSVMFKPKPRTIPTGRAACFPAGLATESPPIPSPSPLDPEPATMNEDSNSSGKLNLCRICGKTYARPSTLKTHMRTHSGERPYRCATCHKSFSQAANLTAHIRTHSGEKPFRCHVCDRRFSQSSSVTTHMRTHSGERPYRCYMCKKSFSDSSTLTKHLRIHSGEKPYQCKLCLLRFSQSGNLNRHMRVHAGSV
ncbi:protein glass-like [Argiope bruennichi]|uniref:Protein glass n=2 Tax=Araneidae TaxID=6913 RepID=A0A8T0F0J8_ARGBR|nr:protein glass-like [Argiope bruennichi]KAF8784656.1 Protein glass like protein [Argiope bruennichi]